MEVMPTNYISNGHQKEKKKKKKKKDKRKQERKKIKEREKDLFLPSDTLIGVIVMALD